MVKPVSLRLRWPAILRESREILARRAEEDRLRRCKKLAAFKALDAARRAYELEEKTDLRFKPGIEQKRWRERRQMVEAELKRIAESS
jgi:hypothetical protein